MSGLWVKEVRDYNREERWMTMKEECLWMKVKNVKKCEKMWKNVSIWEFCVNKQLLKKDEE